MELPENFRLDVAQSKYEGAVLHDQKLGSVEVGLKEAPLYLHVDTDTDWATVIPAGAGVVVALLVAWLTIGVQRNQIQGNIAGFRHHWMSDLREAGSELVQVMNYLANLTTKQDDYKDGQEYLDKCARASQLRAKIDLLLSRDDEASFRIRAASVDALKTTIGLKFKQDPAKAHKKIAKFKNLLRSELEGAWEDMKGDLGVNKRFLFFRLFKKVRR
jgi:hypothetical protein